jgi:hypothetical protein
MKLTFPTGTPHTRYVLRDTLADPDRRAEMERDFWLCVDLPDAISCWGRDPYYATAYPEDPTLPARPSVIMRSLVEGEVRPELFLVRSCSVTSECLNPSHLRRWEDGEPLLIGLHRVEILRQRGLHFKRRGQLERLGRRLEGINRYLEENGGESGPSVALNRRSSLLAEIERLRREIEEEEEVT